MAISLDAALSGLRVAQQSLDAVSRNVSNASTPGYTRKTLPQVSNIIAGQGTGVTARALVRAVDAALVNDVNKQTALSENYTTRMDYLTRIQSFFGAPDSERSVSSKVSNLATAFAQLSTAPNDSTLLNNVILNAQQLTTTINNYSELLTSMRTNAETDINNAVNIVNTALNTIADLNQQIQGADTAGRDTVDLMDLRDIAINTVSKYVNITTFVTGSTNGSQVEILTKQGTILADSTAHPLYFLPTMMLPTSYYPGGGLNGLKVGGATGEDITQSGIGGKLGALFELRDTTLPQYMAQIDEFSQKMAMRFENEGLKFFVDVNGNVPADTPPGYVGFSQNIQVSNAVINNPALIRNGTTGGTENTGSNEVIRRISQFTFGAYQYQQATGSVDISAGALIPLLGLTTQAVATGSANLASYSSMSTVPNLITPSAFDLTIGGVTHTIAVAPGDTAALLASAINTAFGSTVAQINSAGSLQVYSSGNAITFANNTIGAAGMTALGFSFGTTNPPNPSFQIQIGTRPPVTITIAPGDTSVQLLAQLNAVTDVQAVLNGTGRLVITPKNGGDLKVIDLVGTPITSLGISISNVAPASFRQSGLGPSGTISTGLLANSALQDYISSIVTSQSGDTNVATSAQAQENSYLKALEDRNSNISGVNIDQEMSNLVSLQSNYAANAKMIGIVQKLMDELFNAFR